MSVQEFPTKVTRGVTLRADPARERAFRVVDRDTDMHEYPGMTPIAQRERLHRHMANEMGSLDIAAQCLADFAEAPWELRLELARQASDESRHVMALYRRLRELGGRKGEFPIGNFEWNVTCSIRSLVGRLAVQNRTFEAARVDLLGSLPRHWREAGDEETAELLEAILDDEVQHVRFANRWLKEFIRQDSSALLEVSRALEFLSTATEALSAKAPQRRREALTSPLRFEREAHADGAEAAIDVEDIAGDAGGQV